MPNKNLIDEVLAKGPQCDGKEHYHAISCERKAEIEAYEAGALNTLEAVAEWLDSLDNFDLSYNSPAMLRAMIAGKWPEEQDAN